MVMKNRKNIFMLVLLFIFVFAKESYSNFAKTYGGNDSDYAISIQQTEDGGYIVAGDTYSFGAGSKDVWVIKLDAAGNIEWQKAYGGTSHDNTYAIQQTQDNGYIIAGRTLSFGVSSGDAWLIKLDSYGSIEWEKAYGGDYEDYAYAVQQTQDEGYIITGYTLSYGVGYYDVWVIKLDTLGNIEWQKTYGESDNNDAAYSIQQTQDEGYIVAGKSNSFGTGDYDMLVIKLDAAGNIEQQKTYGGDYDDSAISIQQTQDGGYIIAGFAYNTGTPDCDAWVIKLDSLGNIGWEKIYSVTYGNYVNSIKQTQDGGYIVAGHTYPGNYLDAWILKLDQSGNIGQSCSIIYNSSANINNTNITPQSFSATIQSNFAAVNSSSAIISNTSAVINTQCEIYKPLLMPEKPWINDSQGNSNTIIEPDENITLIGVQHNYGIVPATNVSSTISSTDPITIINPNASYPDIEPDDYQICTTCYNIVAPLANRPQTHWDFTISETSECTECTPATHDFIYHIGNSFTDVPSSHIFYSMIESLLHSNITGGCTSSAYCPSANVKREQIAKFICKAMQSVNPSSCVNEACNNYFQDVPVSNIFCSDIEALYDAGVITGCSSSPPLYCPGSYVKRDVLTKIICDSMNISNPGSCVPSSICQGIFTDVDSNNVFCPYIEFLSNAGIINPCSSNAYCPANNVNRGQMAKFIVDAFGLIL